MHLRLIYHLLILNMIAGLFILSGCHNDARSSEKLGFKDERSMREAMKGNWILQEYSDSIDAGLTPKVLGYMFQDLYGIEYTSDSCLLLFAAHSPSGNTIFMNSSLPYSLSFIPSQSMVVFRKVSSEGADKGLPSDTAVLAVDQADTILRFISGSFSLQLVKYDAYQCPGIDAYSHLVNSRFIAGKYYSAGDTGHLHHIIFSKCGIIEGQEYIGPEFKTKDNYGVTLDPSNNASDQITFMDETDQRKDAQAISVDWSVNKDTLTIGKYKLIKSK